MGPHVTENSCCSCQIPWRAVQSEAYSTEHLPSMNMHSAERLAQVVRKVTVFSAPYQFYK